MRTTWLAVAAIVGLVGGIAQTARAAAEDAGSRGMTASCEASLAPGAGLEVGTAYNAGEDGVVRAVRVRTIVEGDDLTVVYDDRIEFYRITGSEQVELIGSIERPASAIATALTGPAHGCS